MLQVINKNKKIMTNYCVLFQNHPLRVYFDLFVVDSDALVLFQVCQTIHNSYKCSRYVCKEVFSAHSTIQTQGSVLVLQPLPACYEQFNLANIVSSNHVYISIRNLFLDPIRDFRNEDGTWSHPRILINGAKQTGKTWIALNLLRSMRHIFSNVFVMCREEKEYEIIRSQCSFVHPLLLDEFKQFLSASEKSKESQNSVIIFDEYVTVTSFTFDECKAAGITVIILTQYVRSRNIINLPVDTTIFTSRLIGSQYLRFAKEERQRLKSKISEYSQYLKPGLGILSTTKPKFYIHPQEDGVYNAPIIFPLIKSKTRITFYC